MRKVVIGIIIICLYCFPFAYYSMQQDFITGSMFGYFLMVTMTSLLAYFANLLSNSIPFIIGNILTAIISFCFISEMGRNTDWGWYFSPASPYQLLFIISFLNLIPQSFVVKLANKHKIICKMESKKE